MLSLRRLLPVLLPVLFIMRPVSLSASWPLDGLPICTTPGNQQGYVKMIRSDTDGFILVWFDDRYGENDIFAQKIDRDGNILWTAEGIPICTQNGHQTYPSIVASGSEGAIITWADYRGGGPGDIYCQRIDADGNRLWNLAGVAVCTASDTQDMPIITSDGAGGAIIAWYDDRSGLSSYENDIYARRVDSGGNVLWTVFGVAICTDSAHQTGLQIASNGYGGAYIAWHDSRTGDNNIYCEQIYSNGSVDYGSDGYGVCTDAASQTYPLLINTGGSKIVVIWEDSRNGSDDLYAQRLYYMGGYYWDNNGIQVATPASLYQYRAVQDDDGAIVICWRDYESGDYDIRAQRLFLTGVPLWPMQGVAVCDAVGDQEDPAIISDGTGGTIVFWEYDNGVSYTLRGQRLDSDGNTYWPSEGISLSQSSSNYSDCVTVPDGEGGAIVSWKDSRAGNTDIYAQRLDRHGYIGNPEPVIEEAGDVPLDQGGKVEITWEASYLDPWPYQEITYYSIWKSLSPASAAMLEENGIEYTTLHDISLDDESEPGTPCGMTIRRETVGAAAYYWELIETQAAQYYEGYSKVVDTDFTSLTTSWTYSYYQVAAHTSDPLVVWTSQPDSGFSLDNLAPSAPTGLAGEQEYAPGGMDLAWNANTEDDLAYYMIYRGTDPSFEPSGSTLLDSAYDTMYFDGGWSWEEGYVYKVSALDIHGNESGYALLLPDQVTGDDPPTPVNRDYLSQNFPNPFNPSTTIQFGLKKRGRVRLCIYDASGRLTVELVNATLPAGDYTETWNGTNASGKHVSSGIYFYRLDAGAFSVKKKMVLLR